MTCIFNAHIARQCGINSALVAGYLWSKTSESRRIVSRNWVRCGLKSMQAAFPFMGERALANAVKRLIRNKIIIKNEFNDSRFDHTAWYSFSEYGEKLMQEAHCES